MKNGEKKLIFAEEEVQNYILKVRETKKDFDPRTILHHLGAKFLDVFGSLAIPSLVEGLNEKNEYLCLVTAEKLVTKAEAAIYAVQDNLLRNEKNFQSKKWSAWILGEIKNRRAVYPLFKALLNEEDSKVKIWILNALTKLGKEVKTPVEKQRGKIKRRQYLTCTCGLEVKDEEILIKRGFTECSECHTILVLRERL